MICVVCGEPIDSDWAAHEYLVKKNAVAPEHQDLILVPENTVFLHNERCHLPQGQSRKTVEKCLWHAARALTATAIGEWYVSLWQEHNLSVPQGTLIPPEDMPLHTSSKLYGLGAKLVGHPVWEGPVGYDVANVAFAAWTGRWRVYRGKVEKKNLSAHIDVLEAGYWMSYLLSII